MVQGTHCAHPLLAGIERSQVGSLKGIAGLEHEHHLLHSPYRWAREGQGGERTNPSHTSHTGPALFLIPTSSLSGDQSMSSPLPECLAKWSTKN